MIWLPYMKIAATTVILGDKNVPATNIFNQLWLRLFVWRTVVIVEVSPQLANAGYRIGFSAGSTCLATPLRSHHQRFALLIGREPVGFFLITRQSEQIPLTTWTRGTREQAKARHIPIL